MATAAQGNELATREGYEITDLQNAGSALATITKAEIDVQISTAHAYPRSLSVYMKKAMAMLTLTKDVAEECFYVIPRGGKTIEGPSVRLAEIVAASYGNMRAGARVVAEEEDFVIAQGICHDLENNLAVTFEVKRRIVDSRGNRFNTDMIGVTGNAASSIAFRNTVFPVVPKVLWLALYEEARKVAKGDAKTFAVKREAVLLGFEKISVPRKKIFNYLGVNGVEDMTSDHLLTLIGVGNAIKNGEANIRDLDTPIQPEAPNGRVEVESDSPLHKTAAAPAQSSAQPAKVSNSPIYIQVDKQLTIISGGYRPIEVDLPKVGGRWDKVARVWTMPAGRTDELISLCNSKGLEFVELDANGQPLVRDEHDQREPGQDDSQELPFS